MALLEIAALGLLAKYLNDSKSSSPSTPTDSKPPDAPPMKGDQGGGLNPVPLIGSVVTLGGALATALGGVSVAGGGAAGAAAVSGASGGAAAGAAAGTATGAAAGSVFAVETTVGILSAVGGGVVAAIFVAAVAAIAITANLVSRASYSYRAFRNRIAAGLQGTRENVASMIFGSEYELQVALIASLGGSYEVGPGVDSGRISADGTPLIIRGGENGTDDIVSVWGLTVEQQRSLAVFARVAAVEQARGENTADGAYFRNENGYSNDELGTFGVALPPGLFDGEVFTYYKARPRTSWGLLLGVQTVSVNRWDGAVTTTDLFDGFGAQRVAVLAMPEGAKLLAQSYFAGQVAAVRYQLKSNRLTLFDGKDGRPSTDLYTAQQNLGNDNGAIYAAAINRTFELGMRQSGWFLWDDVAKLGFNASIPQLTVVKQPGA